MSKANKMVVLISFVARNCVVVVVVVVATNDYFVFNRHV